MAQRHTFSIAALDTTAWHSRLLRQGMTVVSSEILLGERGGEFQLSFSIRRKDRPEGGLVPRGGAEVNFLHFQLERCCPEGDRFQEEEWK